MNESMSTPSANPKWMFWTGVVLSVLVTLAMAMSAVMKLQNTKEVTEGFEHFGFPAGIAAKIGAVELVCVLLYVFPPTSVLGAILMTGYLGGAVVTHVRMGEEFAAPIIIGVLAWLGLVLRDPRLRTLTPWKRS